MYYTLNMRLKTQHAVTRRRIQQSHEIIINPNQLSYKTNLLLRKSLLNLLVYLHLSQYLERYINCISVYLRIYLVIEREQWRTYDEGIEARYRWLALACDSPRVCLIERRDCHKPSTPYTHFSGI